MVGCSLPSMTFDFETPIPRSGTDSQKWQKYADRDVLPMWVADMDFKSSPAILEAIHERVEHGVFGYARPTQSTMDVMVSAMKERYDWTVDPSWIVWLPGLVCGLNVTAQAFAEAGDEVLTLSPIYPPFMTAPKNSARVSVSVPLVLKEAQWALDWEALEAAVTERTKLFLLCNPHNPVARVWTRDELTRIGEFCARHDLVLCSDEIHCDLILDDVRHIPVALTGEEIAKRTITLMAPSKTYNIAGLGYAFAVIENDSTRRAFNDAKGSKLPEINCIAFYAAEAAYKHGESWRQALLTYLKKNRDTISDFIRSEMPYLQIPNIEATYLAWINCGALKTENAAQHLEKDAGLFLSDGAFFSGADHIRFNYGCTNARVLEGLEKIKTSFDKIR